MRKYLFILNSDNDVGDDNIWGLLSGVGALGELFVPQRDSTVVCGVYAGHYFLA
jgi:hypothetical protein